VAAKGKLHLCCGTMWWMMWLLCQAGDGATPPPVADPTPTTLPSETPVAAVVVEEPWVVGFVKTTDDTRSSMERKVTEAITTALLSSESITPAATDDILAAAQQAGISRKQLQNSGALAGVADALDIDYLLFAQVVRSGARYQVKLIAFDRTATTTAATAQIEIAADGKGRGATMTAADGGELVSRVLSQLPARAGQPTQVAEPTTPPVATGGDGFDTEWATADVGSAAVQELLNVLSPTLRGGLSVDSFVYPTDLARTVDPQRIGSRQQLDARIGVTVGRSEQAAGFVQLLMRRDFADPTRARLEAEIAVAQFDLAGVRIKGGRDKLSWGKTDLINVIDVLPQHDYRDVLDIEKFPTWFLSAAYTLGPVTLEASVLPVPEAHLLPAIEQIAIDGTMRSRNRWVKGRFRDLDLTDGYSQNDYQSAAIPVAVTLRDVGVPVPSVSSLQPAVRLKLALAGVDASLGYAYLYDHFPTIRLPAVDRSPFAQPRASVVVEPLFLRKHWVTGDFEVTFGSVRLSGEGLFAATDDVDALFDIDDNDPEVEDPYIAGVIGVDYRTATFLDDHALHFFVNATGTLSLTSSVKITDAITRLRYPIPAGLLARVEYLAGEDLKVEFTAIDGWGSMRLGGPDVDLVNELLTGHDVWLAPAAQMQFFDVVTARVEGAWLLGTTRGIFGRFAENSRIGGSLGVAF
jgi:hypothetical protein